MTYRRTANEILITHDPQPVRVRDGRLAEKTHRRSVKQSLSRPESPRSRVESACTQHCVAWDSQSELRAQSAIRRAAYSNLSTPGFQGVRGMARWRYRPNMGTVNAVSPCVGLHTIPFRVSFARVGATARTGLPSTRATSPDRCGSPLSSAMARRCYFPDGVRRSNPTRKKLPSNSAMASSVAVSTSAEVIGDASAQSQQRLPHS